MKRSALGARRSKVKVTEAEVRFEGLAQTPFLRDE